MPSMSTSNRPGRSAIRILLAIAVLTHALLGCSAHHAHATDAAVEPSSHGPATAAHAGSGSCHHHHAGSGQDGMIPVDSGTSSYPAGDDGSPHWPHEACDVDQCQWLTTKADCVLPDINVGQGDVRFTVAKFGSGCQAAPSHLTWQCHCARPAPLPVRAHLAKGVLLI